MNSRNILVLALSFLGVLARRLIPKKFLESARVGVRLNDIHSKLNPAVVKEIHMPSSTQHLVEVVRYASSENYSVSISGGKHAMGGQQFGSNTVHVGMKDMNAILSFDKVNGLIEVEAGIEWPQLIDYLLEEQKGAWPQWGITQKQTGADDLSIGGAVSANIHGRGIHFKPFIQDIESMRVIDGAGKLIDIDRELNPELFSLVVGGYGLFGAIASVTIRLSRRVEIERVVEIVHIDELPEKVRSRIDEGFLYGDFQYKTDDLAEDFMQVGVFSCYKASSSNAASPVEQRKLSHEDWNSLLYLAHKNKGEAFKRYSEYYMATNGQRYWSDTHQLSYYDKDYSEFLAKYDPSLGNGSLMITEIYVPRGELVSFTKQIAADVKEHSIDVIYGTMRLIKKDGETFLAWAKDDYVCIIFNLRVSHTAEGIEKSNHDFRLFIDRALERGGSYYLTYHRWARKDQVLKAYPQFPDFIALKLKYDPQERFQSDWYRHYKKMFPPT
jgi:FAD/FMN-containing dehydrogenase